MSRPRLAFFHDLPVGGGKRTFHSLIPLLAERFQVEVYEFMRTDNDMLNVANGSGVVRHLFPPPQLPFRFLQRVPVFGIILRYRSLRRAHAAVAAAINVSSPEAVLVSHCRYQQSLTAITSLSAPVVYFCHEPPRGLYEPSIARPYHAQAGAVMRWGRALNASLWRHWDRRLVAAARCLIANSYYSAEVLYRTYGRKATAAQLAVDVDVFASRSAIRENTVLSVGSLNPNKAHDFAIQCVAAVPAAQRPRLIIPSPAGTQFGPEQDFLKSVAGRLGVTLEFRVLTSDTELAQLYSSALATIYCPHLEPFGLVSLESMACGTPVLGVEEGGLRETILDGKTGFLLPWNPSAFALVLQRLQEHPDEREQLGRAGAAWVRSRFTWQRCADTVTEVLMSVIDDQSVDVAS